MSFLRRNPGTAGYLVVLLVVSVVVFGVLPDDDTEDVLRAVSTDLANVDWSIPLRLLGSALVVDLSGGVVNTLVVVVAGIAGCLGWLERRFGTVKAFGIFLAVHVAATLVTLLVIVLALRAGIYPDEVRDELDYGVSYGALGCMGAVTFFLPRGFRVPWAAVVLLLPFLAADWYRWLPDFSTVGHVVSGLLGVAISRQLIRPSLITKNPGIL